MALTRRTGQRFQASIWPGFVDAMTALLLVLMFVLSIFMIVQFMLRETITGQESELNALNAELAALADALGLEQSKSARLETRIGALDSELAQAQAEVDQQAALIASLTSQVAAREGELASAQARITDFEAQVAALLAERDAARAEGAALAADLEALEGQRTRLLSEQERLELALAAARDEMDAQAEAARLAAAKREALEALIADLRARNAEAGETAAALSEQVAGLEADLSEEEKARLAEAAAAQALREKLRNADDELTAMTLALEEQRKRAEDTLTLLAAAEAAKDELDTKLAAALLESEELRAVSGDRAEIEEKLAAALAAKLAAEQDAAERLSEAEQRAALLATARARLAEEEEKSAESARKVALLNQQIAALRTQLGSLQALLDDAAERDVAAQVQIESLGSRLNAALAQVASEQRARADLEEAERKRLEEEARRLAEEAKRLESYRSEFFGRMREVLAGREGVRVVGDRFVFSSEVLFQTGSADLSAEGRAQIANVAAILQEVADEIPPQIDWIVRVDGHTDNQPLIEGAQYADNWELSQARALSVVRFMVNRLGFPPRRLAATGFGEFRPVNTADTPEARALNRRIELKLTER